MKLPENPDLVFIREEMEEALEFYLDDECLEIKTSILDRDNFLIILDPKEITQLIDFLNKYYRRKN